MLVTPKHDTQPGRKPVQTKKAPPVWDAVRFDGTPEHAATLMATYPNDIEIAAIKKGSRGTKLVVHTKAGMVAALQGEYIVWTDRGVEVFTEKEFMNAFEIEGVEVKGHQ